MSHMKEQSKTPEKELNKMETKQSTRGILQNTGYKGNRYGGGVSGSYTNLLPGPSWNYNYIVEKSSGITN